MLCTQIKEIEAVHSLLAWVKVVAKEVEKLY
jgi:hypothetical protein